VKRLAGTVVLGLLALTVTACGAHAPFTNEALADRLGDQGPIGIRGTTVACARRTGTVRGHRFNRVCIRAHAFGYCQPGTGGTEHRLFVWVRVRTREYQIVCDQQTERFTPCQPVPFGDG
jgi:hypothetical protein